MKFLSIVASTIACAATVYTSPPPCKTMPLLSLTIWVQTQCRSSSRRPNRAMHLHCHSLRPNHSWPNWNHHGIRATVRQHHHRILRLPRLRRRNRRWQQLLWSWAGKPDCLPAECRESSLTTEPRWFTVQAPPLCMITLNRLPPRRSAARRRTKTCGDWVGCWVEDLFVLGICIIGASSNSFFIFIDLFNLAALPSTGDIERWKTLAILRFGRAQRLRSVYQQSRDDSRLSSIWTFYYNTQMSWIFRLVPLSFLLHMLNRFVVKASVMTIKFYLTVLSLFGYVSQDWQRKENQQRCWNLM